MNRTEAAPFRQDRRRFRMHGARRAAAFLVIAPLCIALFGYVTMELWNHLIPAIFHLATISFWQALGLVILSKILFGGFPGRRGGARGAKARRWKMHMRDRWDKLSPEERERFLCGIRGRGYRAAYDTPPTPPANPA